ncbi:MAG: ATP-binding protein [Eggerthellaceae bacterium]|nr:ATP-binding protein [Eggerthellaceae bacterium]
MGMHVKVIAITGGPCAGKTSVMGVVRDELVHKGASVRLVPEAATDLIMEGIAPWTCPSMLDFQTQVIRLQLEREADALNSGAAIVVCDRGVCDSRAYLAGEEYSRALSANRLAAREALVRYDAVFHLESIALADPAAYTRANNTARFESVAEAVAADRRTLDAWSAHPNRHIVGNASSLAAKASALIAALVEELGL